CPSARSARHQDQGPLPPVLRNPPYRDFLQNRGVRARPLQFLLLPPRLSQFPASGLLRKQSGAQNRNFHRVPPENPCPVDPLPALPPAELLRPVHSRKRLLHPCAPDALVLREGPACQARPNQTLRKPLARCMKQLQRADAVRLG